MPPQPGIARLVDDAHAAAADLADDLVTRYVRSLGQPGGRVATRVRRVVFGIRPPVEQDEQFVDVLGKALAILVDADGALVTAAQLVLGGDKIEDRAALASQLRMLAQIRFDASGGPGLDAELEIDVNQLEQQDAPGRAVGAQKISDCGLVTTPPRLLERLDQSLAAGPRRIAE